MSSFPPCSAKSLSSVCFLPFLCYILGFVRSSVGEIFCSLHRSCTSVLGCSYTWGNEGFPRRAGVAQLSLGMANHHPQHGANSPVTPPSISLWCSWPWSRSGGRNEGQCRLRASPAQLFSFGVYLNPGMARGFLVGYVQLLSWAPFSLNYSKALCS